MSILSSVALLASFAAIIPPIGPDISSDLDFNYKNIIDYVCVEPLKADSLNMACRFKIKVSFKNALREPGLVKIMMFSPVTYQEGIELKTWSVSKKFQTLEYDFMNSSLLVHEKAANVVISLYSGLGEDEVHMDLMNSQLLNMVVKNESHSWVSNKNICYYKPDIGVTYIRENVVVKECVQDIYLNPGEPLNLDFFYFSYSNEAGMSFNPENPRLVISTLGEHFKNFGTYYPGNEISIIPLKMTKKVGSSYRFEKSETYYVDPLTNEMSTKPINGYIETENLYFPLTTKEEEVYQLRFLIDKFGCNYLKFCYDFNVHTGRKIFGNCLDYEYCLNTRDSEADPTIGTIIKR